VIKSLFGGMSGVTDAKSPDHVGERSGRESLSRPVTSLVRGPEREGKKIMSVFVLDRHQKPLMPCSEKRARLLLERKRAVIHRFEPFCIRLKDRIQEISTRQPVVLKLDPGSRTTGIALARVEETEDGQVHHALHLAHLVHRGNAVKKHLDQRRGYRRRRRSANLRYRKARFLNRRRPKGWLPPSLLSRIGNTLTWARRYQRWTPLVKIEVERVKFDTQLMQNAEVAGVEYQWGELAGWEVRSYLLEKYQRRCVYCGATNGPFEVDHVLPRSRGGSDRVSNLVLSCHACNQAKANQTAEEFGYPEVERHARLPLRDTAAVNATRYALVEHLRSLGLPIGTWSGGRTRWNRSRFEMRKDHALDALCVGDLAGVQARSMRTLSIAAQERGSYSRTNVQGGFPRGYFMRQKRVKGLQTGDLVKAEVPAIYRNKPLKAAGLHRGRVAVRERGSFVVGQIDGINASYCRLLQRADGYAYGMVPHLGATPSAPKGGPASAPMTEGQGHPQAEFGGKTLPGPGTLLIR
jgi:5-methylcytosine-specific restriction endonuclease McrA